MIEQFAMLAGYNSWVNERLYDAAALLPDAEYRADLGAFFGSIHGTLNHILIGDRIWMHVFTGEGKKPTELDAILYDLASARLALADTPDATPTSVSPPPHLPSSLRRLAQRSSTVTQVSKQLPPASAMTPIVARPPMPRSGPSTSASTSDRPLDTL